MRSAPALVAALLAACGPRAPTPSCAGGTAIVHVVLPGGEPVELELVAGRIRAIGSGVATSGLCEVDGGGRTVVPAVIDSHVHLDYLPVGAEHAASGVAAAVDLASPLEFLAADHAPLRLLGSGPMVTSVGGYPTTTWGGPDYGIECATAAEAEAAVSTVVAAGAGVVKVPVLTDGSALSTEALVAAVEAAHARGLGVVAHALDEPAAAAAREAGADILAHTPLSELSDDTVAAWSGGAVITTMRAFGSGAPAVDNLRRLHQAGATVLFGSDLGNASTPGVDDGELELMLSAGLTPAEVLAATTSVPAAFWGFDDLGELRAGAAGSVLLLDGDPLVDPGWLSKPAMVYLDGAQVAP